MPPDVGCRSIRLILRDRDAVRSDILNAVASVRSAGHAIDVRAATGKKQVGELASEAARQNVDVIAVGGGDGTINRALNGMITAKSTIRSALAIVPLGTANDFARSCGLRPGDPSRALQAAANGRAQMIDVLRVDGRLFLNASVIGVGADATGRAKPPLKRLARRFSYVAAGLLAALGHRPHECTFRMPDETFSCKAMFAAVSNTPFAGGVSIAPQARMDDGLIDVVVIPAVPFHGLPLLALDFLRLRRGVNAKYITYRQASWLEITAAETIPARIDGRRFTGTTLRFEVLKRHLPLILPERTA